MDEPAAHAHEPSGCCCPCGCVHGQAVSEQFSSHRAPFRPSMQLHGGTGVADPPLTSHVPPWEQCAWLPFSPTQFASR